MSARTRTILGAASLAAAVLLGAVILIVAGTGPLPVDSWWNGLMIDTRTDAAIAVARAADRTGGGLIATLGVPAATLLALLLARRWRAAVFAVTALALSATVVQLLKHLFARARPGDMLVTSDFGSFPSGHTANAAALMVVLWVLFPRWWVALIGAVWVVVMALSRTILSVHWLTDTAGGALVGVGVALLAAAAAGGWIARDRPPAVGETAA